MSERPPEEATTDPALASDDADGRAYHVKLPMFEGPLDLLLHLIQKHELNILDIPIGFVALKYVEYIRMMEEMSIDLASEYLVMAATLAYIKSRSLLPPDPSQEAEEGADEEEEDPRAELIRKLLEYQKYKHAADNLGQREVLGRDVFQRGFAPEHNDEEAPLAPMSLFKLVDAFESVLKRVKQVQEHQIDFEKVSISDRIGQIVERLRSLRTLQFEQLFDGDVTRAEMIVTFLALLEMTKLRMTRLTQEGPLAPIVIELVLSAEQARNFDAERAFEQMHHAVEQDFAADKPWSEQEPDPATVAPPWEASAEELELSEEELAEELREAAQAFALGERDVPSPELDDQVDSEPAGQLSTFGPPEQDDFSDEGEGDAIVGEATEAEATEAEATEPEGVAAPVLAWPSQDEVGHPISKPNASPSTSGPDEAADDTRVLLTARCEVEALESAVPEAVPGVALDIDEHGDEKSEVETGPEGDESSVGPEWPIEDESSAGPEWPIETDVRRNLAEPSEQQLPTGGSPGSEPETEDQEIATEEGSQDPKGSDVESR
jgi:segregation and condensation protein A